MLMVLMVHCLLLALLMRPLTHLPLTCRSVMLLLSLMMLLQWQQQQQLLLLLPQVLLL